MQDVLHVLILDAAVVHPTVHASQPLDHHRHEDTIHKDQRAPEVDFPQDIIHLATGSLGEPVVDACEQREDCAWGHDVVEMSYDVERVVEMNIRYS